MWTYGPYINWAQGRNQYKHQTCNHSIVLRLSASWGMNLSQPWNPLGHHGAMVYGYFKGLQMGNHWKCFQMGRGAYIRLLDILPSLDSGIFLQPTHLGPNYVRSNITYDAGWLASSLYKPPHIVWGYLPLPYISLLTPCEATCLFLI